MNTNRRISMELAPGWKDESIYFFRGPDQAGIQHSLNVTVDSDPGKKPLEDYAKERIAMLKASQPGMEILKQGSISLDDGASAYELVFKWNPGGPKPYFARQVWLYRDGMAFTFAGKYAKATSRTLGVAIDQMIKSFRVEG